MTEIDSLELCKLPKKTDDTDLWYWMKFIKTDDRKELEMLAKRNPRIKKAVGVLKELSADERTRMLYEEREKARRDIASRMGGAEEKGRTEKAGEIALKLLKMEMPIEQIIEVTGLTREEIQALYETV